MIQTKLKQLIDTLWVCVFIFIYVCVCIYYALAKLIKVKIAEWNKKPNIYAYKYTSK